MASLTRPRRNVRDDRAAAASAAPGKQMLGAERQTDRLVVVPNDVRPARLRMLT
jgi:hypothetical protein